MASTKRAAQAKEKGNKLFKDGYIKESAKQYAQAEKLDPANPVYPSNLSAALFELGDYLASSDAILRSWSKSPESELAVKLATRLPKSLNQGVHNGTIDHRYIAEKASAIEALEGLSTPEGSQNAELWGQWKRTRSKLEHFQDLAHVAKVRFSQMPIYKGTPDQTMTFFSIGTDEIISLVDGWGPDAADPLKMQNFVNNQSPPLAFLFGGVGDARHVFGTLIGLARAQKKLKPAQKKVLKQVHLTVLDVHFAMVARDLLVCWLVNTLVEDQLDATGRLEVQSSLVYMYTGWAMPDYAHARMMTAIRELITKLSSGSSLPVWLHVDVNSVDPILRALTYWSTTRTVTASGFLTHHSYVNSIDRLKQMSSISFGDLGDPLSFKRKQVAQNLDRMSAAELRRLGDMYDMAGAPIAKVREMINDNKEMFVENIVMADLDKNRPWGLENEAAWYKRVKVFVPSPKMWHLHPGFDCFREIKEEKVSEPKLKKIVKDVLQSWKPNNTLLDGTREGYPLSDFDVFTTIQQIAQFNKDMGLDAKVDKESPTFSYVSTFFDNLAAAVKALGGSIQLEFMCGEVNQEMSKIRLQTDSRPDHFPKKFTRIWLSNVPDYTNGTLNTAIYVLPVLQDTSDSAVSSNCLWNTPVWKNNAQFCYTYTLLLPKDLPRYLGLRELNGKAVMDLLTLGANPLPRPISTLASRENLRDWLTRLFISMVAPGTFQRRPDFVKLPNTLVVFVALLIELKNVGYPSHWLADYVQSFLNGTLVTDQLAYRDTIPRPVSDLHRRGTTHRLRTDPWLADFEAILASSRDGLPFALQMPEGLAAKASDIGYYKASIHANMFYSNPMMRFPENDAVLSLLFYKDAKQLHSRVSKTAGTMNWFLQEIPAIVDGQITPPPGSFHIVTADRIDLAKGEVAWRISKAKMERMRRENWSMVAWRTDFWTDTTEPCPASRWQNTDASV